MRKGDIVYPLVQREGTDYDYRELICAEVICNKGPLDFLIRKVKGKMYFQKRDAISLYVNPDHFTTIASTVPSYTYNYEIF